LFGAFSFAVSANIDLDTWGLAQAGFWNYLREDITVALECRRPLHLTIKHRTPESMTGSEQDHSNSISFLLAKVINVSFAHENNQHIPVHEDHLQALRSELKAWTAGLPESFQPTSTALKKGNAFPSLWMLQPWHTAAQQYASVTALLLSQLRPGSDTRDEVVSHALRVCGLAYTNENSSARLNSFGPLSYCGRFLRDHRHRLALCDLLKEMANETGWNVEPVLQDLYICWGESDLTYSMRHTPYK